MMAVTLHDFEGFTPGNTPAEFDAAYVDATSTCVYSAGQVKAGTLAIRFDFVGANRARFMEQYGSATSVCDCSFYIYIVSGHNRTSRHHLGAMHAIAGLRGAVGIDFADSGKLAVTSTASGSNFAAWGGILPEDTWIRIDHHYESNATHTAYAYWGATLESTDTADAGTSASSTSGAGASRYYFGNDASGGVGDITIYYDDFRWDKESVMPPPTGTYSAFTPPAAGTPAAAAIAAATGLPGLELEGAVNVIAGTQGVGVVAALNLLADPARPTEQNKDLAGVLNELAGTTGLGVDAAAGQVDWGSL